MEGGCRKVRLKACVGGHIIYVEISHYSGVTSYGRICRKGAGKQGVEYASVDIFVEIKSAPSMA